MLKSIRSEAIHLLVVYEAYGEIFFQFGKNNFMGTADGCLLMKQRGKSYEVDDHGILIDGFLLFKGKSFFSYGITFLI